MAAARGERAAVGVELAEPQPDQQLAADRAVHVVHGDQAALERRGDLRGGEPAVPVMVGEAVQACPQRGRVRLRVVAEVVLGPAPGSTVPMRRCRSAAPHRSSRGSRASSGLTCAGRPLTRLYDGMTPVAAPASIGARNGGRSYSCSTRGAQPGGGQVPEVLVVVAEEVLQGGGGEQVAAVVPGLVGPPGQALAEGGAHERGEQRVLGVALLVPAPAGVAQQVHDRRPDVEADQRVLVVQRRGSPARWRGRCPWPARGPSWRRCPAAAGTRWRAAPSPVPPWSRQEAPCTPSVPVRNSASS